jgi:ribonucleoside-diphosphate reductase alpha chain
MQAALQRHIDQSISSTVNLPRDTSVDTVERLYRHAWRSGLKGISVYREGSREGVLLTSEEAKRRHSVAALSERVAAIAREAAPTLAPDGSSSPERQIEATVRALAELVRSRPEQLQLLDQGDGLLRERPERLDGPTYRIPTAFGTAFVTITERDGEPFEVFARLGKAGSDAEADAEGLGRLCSVVLRLRGRGSGAERLRLIVDQLEGIGASRQYGFGPNRVRSIPDAIAVALRKYLADRHPTDAPELPCGDAGSAAPAAQEPQQAPVAGDSNGNLCPRCLQRSLVTTEGCTRCQACGFREC